MSPRRSSRARTTQPPAPPPEHTNSHTNSSTSSNSQTRAERSTRSQNRLQSPNRTSAQRSESLEDPITNGRPEPLATRRSRRGNDNGKEDIVKSANEDEDVDEADKDITRCICGQALYPGPPALAHHRSISKIGLKDETNPTHDGIGSDSLSDDTGDFFIQCDSCQVWQHGGCVGLTDESMSPDYYYCEQCRPDFHRVCRVANSSKYSRYLPVLEPNATPRSSSTPSSQEPSQTKEGKSGHHEASLSTKRRATMNSRDAAYDEDEMLRRAIKESKEMGTLGKRVREDSEEHKSYTKRQRTSSSSQSTLSRRSRSPTKPASDDEAPANTVTTWNGNTKPVRGTAPQIQREKETRDRQKEVAAQRAEAASKRKARSERRRGEESPTPTPGISPLKAPSQPPIGSQGKIGPDTPSSHRLSTSQRKTGRPPARRGRLGRNQYTRDLPVNGDAHGSPSQDHPHDKNNQSGSPSRVAGGAFSSIHGESGRTSRPKHHGSKTSLNEMKRRVAAILEFIGHLQAEGSSQHTSGSASSQCSKGGSTPNGAMSVSSSNANLHAVALARAVEAAGLSAQVNGEGQQAPKAYSEMASTEMMETLTKELLSWQSLYGKYGEK